jgi:tetratricopeptide (TPR) repeat protein
LTDDAFLIRDLGIEPESVTNPLTYTSVKYSGERLILIPTLVDPELKRDELISWLSQFADENGSFGVVSIVPSFHHARDWKKSKVTHVRNLYENIDELKTKVKLNDAKQILVLVNEYDGVDLPDSACRILCIDSLPSYSSLIDRNAQSTRPGTSVLRRIQAQKVEQGIGRAIRGSNDWCIVVIIGNNLTDFLSENAKRIYFSNEAQMQIKIGEELSSIMKTEGQRLSVIETLINQCINRDPGWKEYYKTRMSDVETKPIEGEYVERSLLERKAEILFQQDHFQKAIEEVQKLVVLSSSDYRDKGWYLQLKALYQYPLDSSKSMDIQLKAYTENDRLFRPEKGITYSKLLPGDSGRASIILNWISGHESHNSLIINMFSILDKITFKISSDLFEEGIDELGELLGFSKQRPEKVTGTGPDNLWHIRGKEYWIIECKNMVTANRGISKSEAGQLNTSIAWFKQNYEGLLCVPIFIHKAVVLEKDAFITDPAWVLQPEKLENLKNGINNFYNSLKEYSFDTLSLDIINRKLKESHLEVEDLRNNYLTRVKDNRI